MEEEGSVEGMEEDNGREEKEIVGKRGTEGDSGGKESGARGEGKRIVP